jgi:hypothetical protein
MPVRNADAASVIDEITDRLEIENGAIDPPDSIRKPRDRLERADVPNTRPLAELRPLPARTI